MELGGKYFLGSWDFFHAIKKKQLIFIFEHRILFRTPFENVMNGSEL